MSLLEDAKELFGEMRNLTKEEQEAYSKGLDEISEDTGINLFDYEPRKVVKIKGRVTKVYRTNNELETNRNDLIIYKPFYEYEIDVLKKMCSICFNNDNFTESEKQIIESILENTLV